jgi:hypothetical protein
MRSIYLALVFSLTAGSLIPQQVNAQSIFRLFSTPAERAALERERQRLLRPGTVEPAPAAPVVEMPAPVQSTEEREEVIYRLGGTVVRNDGRYTVWLNGTPVDQEDLPAHMELLSPYAQGTLLISNPENGARYELKPGQVLNLTTGTLFESYEFQEPLLQTVRSVTETEADPDTLADPDNE